MTLRWLDRTNRETFSETKKKRNCFNFDFKSLYHSLEPNLVKEALRHAVDEDCPNWSNNLESGIITLIDFSLRASVAKYGKFGVSKTKGFPQEAVSVYNLLV